VCLHAAAQRACAPAAIRIGEWGATLIPEGGPDKPLFVLIRPITNADAATRRGQENSGGSADYDVRATNRPMGSRACGLSRHVLALFVCGAAA
jgi:hypothetical protein